jgi:ABC-type transporter Mla maintaining outer membrane lipid asymmetry ATPase subunit MlaF
MSSPDDDNEEPAAEEEAAGGDESTGGEQSVGEERTTDEESVDDEESAGEKKAADDEERTRTNYLVPDVEPFPLDADEPIIELRDVHKSFDGEEVLSGLSLSITPGEITVIIGASGSGKTVLIKHMNGLIEPDSGEVRLFGTPTSEMSDQELVRARKRIGTLFQSYALFDSMSVVENVAFPLIENGAMKEREAQEHARELLEMLGLGEALAKYPSELSGGMKKRVSLARAIVTNPEVVLFDEPTTGLDPIMMEFVDDLIEETTEDFALTSVIISHDMASTFRLADSIAVLHDGGIIAHDDPRTIREMEDERVMRLVRGITKEEVDVEGASEVDWLAEEDVEYAIEVLEVDKRFGDLPVLQSATMRVPKHKITVLIGGSGEGKSVMMKHILKLMEPDEGTVKVFGKDLADLDEAEMRELRTQIGMLFQHAALFDSMTVAENVAFPLIERQIATREEADERVGEILERLNIEDVRDRFPPGLSSGAQKRVSLARALITEPPLLIYDEPTTGQDPMMTRQVEDMIDEVQNNFDVTSLLISHDMSLTFRIADHVALLKDGSIIAEGPPRSLLESDDPRVEKFIFASEIGAHLEHA